MNSNPTAAEAEQALKVYDRVPSLCQGVLADLLANRPEALQPKRPTDSEGYMLFPSVLYAKCDAGCGHSGWPTRRIAGMQHWHDLATVNSQSAGAWKDAASIIIRAEVLP